MSAGPDSVTVTPGSTDLVLSVTVPLMAPVVEVTAWAEAARVNAASDSRTITTPVTRVITRSCSLLLANELHRGQRARVRDGLVAGRESIRLKHVRDDVEDVVLAEGPRRILGHRGLDAAEERADQFGVPLHQKLIAPELWPHRAVIVARRALGVVCRPAAFR